MLVLARPGSGKTHTLAARAGSLLTGGIDARQILAMTFSRRAAEALRDRLPGAGIWAGTFHAVCTDILEQYGAAIGIRAPFRIVDEIGSREYLIQAIQAAGFPLPADPRPRERWLREIEGHIERRKRQGLQQIVVGEGSGIGAETLVRVDETYCRLLREANALDFADLVAKAVQLLTEDEPTAEALRGRLTHLLVDEAHDISPEQYQLISLLLPPAATGQLFIVGDPEQAIYAWRGADAARILARYRADYRPHLFQLTMNYRSRSPIVAATDAYMREAGRTQASRSNRAGRVSPVWCQISNEQHEAREVVSAITRAIDSGAIRGFGAFAVLYRTHAAGDLVEAELLRAEIPLWRVQRRRFFDDENAQESLRFLELAYGLHRSGFEPALNWPRTIVDELTMVHLRRLAERRGWRLSDLLWRIDELRDDVSPLTRGVVKEFLRTIGRDLEPLVTLPMLGALDPFLRALAVRRSPIPRSARGSLRDTLDFVAGSLGDATQALSDALAARRPVAIRARPGPDAMAAAIIVRHALQGYFEAELVDIEASASSATTANVFVVTLGEEQTPGPDRLGIGPLQTRTAALSVATRAWRLMQLLLMTRETLDQDACLMLDVETTTRHPERAEILEFGLLPFVGGAIAESGFVSLVRPSSAASIDPIATDMHGLRWLDVADAPTPSELLPLLFAELDGQVVVGHNIEEFDLPVLLRAAENAGLSFRHPHAIDTRRMAERVWPGEPSYRMEDLARRCDPGAAQRHRARDDCLLTGKVFAQLLHDARRDREIDVLSECLPLVAASILSGDMAMANDNELLAGMGGRAQGLGQGASLFTEWTRLVDPRIATTVGEAMGAIAVNAPEDDARWQRLIEGWQTAVAAICDGEPNMGIDRFLHYAALAQPIDALPRGAVRGDDPDPRFLTRDERVALMTIHSAKGLEWPVVFIVGVEDDQFPHHRSVDDDELAEERRILYVGMTRACDRLYLFSAQSRNGHRKRRSRFIEPLIGASIDTRSPSTP